MTLNEFKDIIQDIERNLEPAEAYWIDVLINDAWIVGYSWTWVRQHDQSAVYKPADPGRVIVLSMSDRRPIYVPLSSIEAIQLGEI